MSVKSIVATILRDELPSIGIRSLTAKESERIAAQIFERIMDLNRSLLRVNSPRCAAIATSILVLSGNVVSTSSRTVLESSAFANEIADSHRIPMGKGIVLKAVTW